MHTSTPPPARRGADGLRRSCLEVGCDRLGRDAALLGWASLDRALLPAEVELDPDEHCGQRRDAPPHALRELAGDQRRAGIGHGRAQAEDERPGDVILRGALCDPGHEVATHQCPGVEAPQQTDPDEPDRHGAEHHLVEVEVLEEEHVPDPIRAGELTPGEKEAEGASEQRRGDRGRDASSVGHPALHHVTALIRKLAAIAVPMKVAVAEKNATDPCEQPPRPLPDVHPPASFAPKPINTPPPKRRAMTTASLSKVLVSQPKPLGTVDSPASSRQTRLPPKTPTTNHHFQSSSEARPVARSRTFEYPPITPIR